MKIFNAPQGNISLIMIFVLAIGSIIGLMSTSFVQDMLHNTRQLREFYGSYYAAKGGIELGNLMVNRYEYGFEHTIPSDAQLMIDNLECSSRSCGIDLDIVSRFHNTSNHIIYLNDQFEVVSDLMAMHDHQFSLKPGESLIFPPIVVDPEPPF